MPDHSKKGRPQDPTRVNVNEESELEYWAERFGVSLERVREAVTKVGESAEDVEHEIIRAA